PRATIKVGDFSDASAIAVSPNALPIPVGSILYSAGKMQVISSIIATKSALAVALIKVVVLCTGILNLCMLYPKYLLFFYLLR
ncbi:MAG: hypothetical protein ACI9N3_002947, partial [Colwellia sp.]